MYNFLGDDSSLFLMRVKPFTQERYLGYGYRNIFLKRKDMCDQEHFFQGDESRIRIRIYHSLYDKRVPYGLSLCPHYHSTINDLKRSWLIIERYTRLNAQTTNS